MDFVPYFACSIRKRAQHDVLPSSTIVGTTVKLCVLLLSMIFATHVKSQSFDTVRPLTVFSAQQAGLHRSGQEACVATMNKYNSFPNYSVRYENPEYAVTSQWGEVCYYDVYSSSTGQFQNRVPYQWVWSERVCPAGYSGPHATSTGYDCRRYVGPKAPICPNPVVGNPVDIANGEKVLEVDDIPSVDGVGFSRTYRSLFKFSRWGYPSPLGWNWYGTYLQYLHVFDDQSTTLAPIAVSVRPDGTLRLFQKSSTTGTWKADVDGACDELTAVTLPSGAPGFQLKLANGTREFYSQSGKLQLLIGTSGVRHTLTYDAHGLLRRVANEKGRGLSFEYSPESRLIAVKGDQHERADFSYTSGNLTKADYSIGGYQYEYQGTSQLMLTKVKDRSGQLVASYQYNGQLEPVESKLAGDVNRHTYDYSTANKVVVGMPGGSTRTYSYHGALGRRVIDSVQETCVGCQARQTGYGFSAALEMTQVTEGQLKTCRAYNSDRLEISQVVGASVSLNCSTLAGGTFVSRSETDWDVGRRLKTEERLYDASNALIRKESWVRDGDGRVLNATVLDAATGAQRTTSYNYCTAPGVAGGACPIVGLLLSVDGPRSGVLDTTVFEYHGNDSNPCISGNCPYRKGDLKKVVGPNGNFSEHLRYDGSGRLLTVVNESGVRTDYEYDSRGRVVKTAIRGANDSTELDDSIMSYSYTANGLLANVLDADGVSTNFAYDPAGRLVGITDASGNQIVYTLDNAGNTVKEEVKGAGGQLKRTQSRVYNTLGELATQADAQANPTDFTYDAVGNIKTVTDALGHVTSSDYDPLNRLKRTLQDVGGIEAETKFEYDANDNLTKVTDPKGLDTTYTYNGFGDQVQLNSPDTGITTFTYDSAGNRTSQTDARGITTTYQYDALNRLTQVAYPTSSLNVSYTYDVTQPVCQAGETFSVGRLTLMVDGSGSTQYCHDRFGQLVRKVQTTNGVALTLRYAYTKGGQLQAMTYPDGTVVDYLRNAQGQIIEVGVARPSQAREVLLTQATYHPFGPIAGWVYGNGRVMQRNMDLDYRPTSIHGGLGGLDLSYGYDAVGNLTGLSSGSPPPLEYRYDALGRLTESRDGPTQAIIDQYTYDKTGNRTSFTDSLGTKAYAYPSTSHRLSSMAGENRTYDAGGNTLSIGTAREFDYNDAGRMSQVRNGGVIAMKYAYNGRGEQVRKYLGVSETQALYDEAGHWLGDYGSSGTASQQAVWMDDMPVGALAGGQLYYIQPDHLGSPRLVIERSRDVAVWTWDPKGEAFGSTLPDQDVDRDAVPFILSLRFPGQRHDSLSGLNHNYFRDYSPATGRYAQSDPIGLRGGVSTYTYVFGSPLQLFDATGLQARGMAANARGGAVPGYGPVDQLDPNNVDPNAVGGSTSGPRLKFPSINQFSTNLKALGLFTGALVDTCLDGEDRRCEVAKADAARAYHELQTRSIPQYLYASRHGGADAGHYQAITQGQRALKNAIARVRANCPVDPPEMPKWQLLANQLFAPR